MLNSTEFIRDDALVIDAILSTAGDAPAVVAALQAPSGTLADAGLAIAAGLSRVQAAVDALLPLLDRDDVVGTAAAWALAQLDSEAAVLAVINGGGIDQRTNGYHSLAVRVALGTHSATLADALVARVADECERAKSKRTGLGDLALKPLAMLSDKRCADSIQLVQDSDPYTNKFELQRLRKAVSDGGKDSDSLRDLRADWAEQFADHLYVEKPAPAPEPAKPAAKAPAAKKAAPAAAKPPVAKKAAPLAPIAAEDVDLDPVDDGADAVDAEAEGEAPTPIDWEAFTASDEGQALPEQVRALGAQLGPLLEQLAARAMGAGLADLSGQELTALLLQVMPQALPPQHVQAALSPQAIHAYQGIAKYLSATGLAVHGDDLLNGVKMVREALQAQIRRSGMLGGPDYSDPDEVAQA